MDETLYCAVMPHELTWVKFGSPIDRALRRTPSGSGMILLACDVTAGDRAKWYVSHPMPLLEAQDIIDRDYEAGL